MFVFMGEKKKWKSDKFVMKKSSKCHVGQVYLFLETKRRKKDGNSKNTKNLTKVYGKGENLEVHALNGAGPLFPWKKANLSLSSDHPDPQIYITASDWRGGLPDVRQGLCGR